MKLIKRIEKHEMLRRWAIAEVYVAYLMTITEVVPQKLLQLLSSNELNLERAAIRKSLKPQHIALLDCLPTKVSWYLAELETVANEFDKLQTLRVPEFEELSANTCELAAVAKQLYKYPGLSDRISRIKQATKRRSKTMQWLGITLLCRSTAGPFVIIDGNGRLISLYQILFLEQKRNLKKCRIEVVLGISDEDFELGYQYVEEVL